MVGAIRYTIKGVSRLRASLLPGRLRDQRGAGDVRISSRPDELAQGLRGDTRTRPEPEKAISMKNGSGLEAERLGASSTTLEPVAIFRARTSAAKRALDLCLVVPALLVAAPIMLLAMIAIKLFDRGPIFFSHPRVGLDGKMFPCFKFRTMHVDAQERLNHLLATNPAAKEEWTTFQKLRRDPRVTLIGRFLRRTSIDELPQLYNILRRDMSVVGPRPITSGEIHRYGADFQYYTGVRPGVLGLWQVNGRNKLTYDERVQMDVEYVKTWSIWLDFKILLRAIPVVLLGLGAY
jgi:exopolysaccharide production protein ExoY